ncbi:hypothetical protein GGF32_005753 [Allomyces javanicus]|nr:hypothetical protein GGF32_005753 [Allomyces javanicus]
MPKKRTNPTKRAENRSSGALTDASLAAAAAAAPTALLVPPAAPPRQKPAITPVAPNTNRAQSGAATKHGHERAVDVIVYQLVLARLNAFLPAMAQSNDALMAAIARDGRDKYDIEKIDQRDGPVIQMKLGLGLFEGRSPTDTNASGSAGHSDVTMALDRLRLPGTAASSSSSSSRRPGITDLTATVSSDSSDSDPDSDASMADGDDEDARTRPRLVPVNGDVAMDVDSDEDDSSDDEEEGAGAPPISLEAMVTDFFNQGLDDSESEDESAGDESSDEEMEERRP